MSILTKIFVVLTTILAVLLTALIVPYVKNTDTYKQQRDDARQLLASAEKQAQAAGAALAQAQDAMGRTIQRLEEDKKVLETRIAEELKPRIDELNSAIVRLNDQISVKEEQISQVTAGTDQQADIIRTMQAQLTTAQTEVLEVKTKLTDLNDRLQERTVSLETATENVRLLKETMQDLSVQLEEAQQQSTVASADGQPIPVPAIAPIRGTVRSVETVDGEVFVSISVGTNDGVAEGMMFLIHDGADNLLGELKITNADLNVSAGRVTLVRGEIARNNHVLTADF